MSQGTLQFAAERRILSVSQITASIKSSLEREFEAAWVRGEVGSLKVHSSGHVYFNLKDAGASLRAVLFKGVARSLKFKLAEGQELLVRGRITVYEPRGDYQLVAESAEPVGMGALQLAIEQLKARLLAEGLFEASRKRPLPFFPRTVGVVTSPSGAALRDILAVLARRAPGVEVLIAPVKVQGEGSAREIADGIAALDRTGACDVMIVGRGGGSLEDLMAFNDEVVARALAACRTPTVSAVGHEVDVTIADFVADRRAPTPSAAAEIVVPDGRELRGRVGDARARLEAADERRARRRREAVDDLRRRLRDPRRVLADVRMRVDDLHSRGTDGLRRALAAHRVGVSSLRRALLASGPHTLLARDRQRLERARALLAAAHARALAARGATLAGLAGRLDGASPLAVLNRGYALVRDEATARGVKRAGEVSVGQSLAVRLAEGEIGVRVTRKGEG